MGYRALIVGDLGRKVQDKAEFLTISRMEQVRGRGVHSPSLVGKKQARKKGEEER